MATKIDDGRASFLDLPPELRNVIYSYCLIARRRVTIPGGAVTLRAFDARLYWQRQGLVPALLSTCRAVNSEASSILYGSNSFEATPEALKDFVQEIGAQAKHLRRVKIGVGNAKALASGLSSIKKCEQIEVVELSARVLDYSEQERVVKAIGPFARYIHRKRKGTDNKTAMDVLVFESGVPHPFESEEAYAKLDKKIREIKEMVKATLK